jgi:hypothetical protein
MSSAWFLVVDGPVAAPSRESSRGEARSDGEAPRSGAWRRRRRRRREELERRQEVQRKGCVRGGKTENGRVRVPPRDPCE